MALLEVSLSHQPAAEGGPVHEFPPDPRVVVMQSAADSPAAEAAKQDAFASIFNEFQGELTGYVSNIAGAYRAEDIVQETFLCAFRKMGSFETRSENALSSWLYTIAHNKALNATRKDKYEADGLPEIDGQPAAIANRPSRMGDPIAQMEFKETLGTLASRVCETQRTAMMLSAGGYSQDEMARMQGTTIPAIKSRLTRGQEVARRALEAQGLVEATA